MVLLEMDEEVMKTLTGMSHKVVAIFYFLTSACAGCHSTFMCALPLLCL